MADLGSPLLIPEDVRCVEDVGVQVNIASEGIVRHGKQGSKFWFASAAHLSLLNQTTVRSQPSADQLPASDAFQKTCLNISSAPICFASARALQNPAGPLSSSYIT